MLSATQTSFLLSSAFHFHYKKWQGLILDSMGAALRAAVLRSHCSSSALSITAAECTTICSIYMDFNFFSQYLSNFTSLQDESPVESQVAARSTWLQVSNLTSHLFQPPQESNKPMMHLDHITFYDHQHALGCWDVQVLFKQCGCWTATSSETSKNTWVLLCTGCEIEPKKSFVFYLPWSEPAG